MNGSLLEAFWHYLLQAAAYVGPFTLVAGAVWAVVRFLHRTVGKRRTLKRAVEQLTTSVRVQYIEGLIGPAKFRRQRDDLVEHVFVTEYCSVQAFTLPDDTVSRIAVTATSDRFHPEFWLGLPGSWPTARVRLGRTRFGDISLGCTWKACRGARRFQYWEKYYLGNPGGYQTYVLAVSDSGVVTMGDLETILSNGTFEGGGSSADEEKPATMLAAWDQFRNRTVVNTFAIAADDATATFGWIGADLDLVRLLPRSRWRRRKLAARAVHQIEKIAPDRPMVTTRRRRRRGADRPPRQ